MSKKKSSDKQSNDNDDELKLNELKLPIYVSHLKSGNTLCANDNLLILQNGSTTLEIRTLPKFEPKHIPWHEGLLRDIVWCSELGLFIFLTQNALFTFNPQSIASPSTTTINTEYRFKIISYSTIKPYDNNSVFWRCTCVGTTVYITYSGSGTVIDEYILEKSSCKLINRWMPPQTCATYEGIWCIRSHPNTNQLGMTILNLKNNQWHFEIRNSNNLSQIWETIIPILHGDCELSPLLNNEWLLINSCGIRLFQIGNLKFKTAVEYERELKNAITIKDDYFIVRTKYTIEIHATKKKNKN
ncbi:unnamed protein product [Rotaria sordida]|uniref:Uncharacterized protein n=1 Tax=Rotaria sordida TaxID=392033 RepID=A0A814MK29_9BILA|nr:unnamed protein product [Rotaria sordida]CAF4109211.1 unnamed protein product [Rotaria sordida]